MIPDLFDWPWFTWLIAALTIVLGLALCFKGRYFLKPSLGILGAGVGAMFGIKIADQLAVNFNILFNDPRLHYVFVVGSASVLCAAVSVLVWKAALALLTGFLGYTVATALEAVPIVSKIVHGDTELYLYHAYYAVSLLLPMSLLFLPDRWLVPVVSGAVGGGLAAAGLDVFVDTGLVGLLSKSMTSMAVPEVGFVSEPILLMALAWALTSATGAIYQLVEGDDGDDPKEIRVKQHVYFDDI